MKAQWVLYETGDLSISRVACNRVVDDDDRG
jgi:hypothetical protein